jgi:hypothetical protein
LTLRVASAARADPAFTREIDGVATLFVKEAVAEVRAGLLDGGAGEPDGLDLSAEVGAAAVTVGAA